MARKNKSLEVSTFNTPTPLVGDETATFDNGILNDSAWMVISSTNIARGCDLYIRFSIVRDYKGSDGQTSNIIACIGYINYGTLSGQPLSGDFPEMTVKLSISDKTFTYTQQAFNCADGNCGTSKIQRDTISVQLPYTEGSPSVTVVAVVTVGEQTETHTFIINGIKDAVNRFLGSADNADMLGDQLPSYYINKSNLGAKQGNIPVIGEGDVLNPSIIPSTVITHTFVVGSESEMLALQAKVGDIAIRTDIKKTFILQTEPASTIGNWTELLFPDAVTSVNNKTGNVVLTKADIGLSNVDNTSDANKPISTATQAALNNKANTSGTYTGLTAGKVANALTFTGTVTGTYDGSAAKTVNIPDASKVPNALTISLNGTSQGGFDGSAAKSINITPSSIGASPTAGNTSLSQLAQSVKFGSGNNFTILQDGGTYWQKIECIDNFAPGNDVFTFSQSVNSGSTWAKLFSIRDNGTVTATRYVGRLANAVTFVDGKGATVGTYDGSSAKTITVGSGTGEIPSKIALGDQTFEIKADGLYYNGVKVILQTE